MKLALAILAVVNYANADCDEWVWEECSWMYYRDYCVDVYGEPEYGVEDDCGWFYWDDWN